MDAVDRVLLKVEGGPDDGQEVPITEATTVFGRQSGADVVVPEAEVSRKHAEIVEQDGMHYLRDLGSTNGTFVNSEKIPEGDRLLQDGDQIRLGSAEVSFVFRAPVASTLAITLEQPAMDPLTVAGDLEVMSTQAIDLSAGEEELFEGTVRLNVRVEGGMGLVVSFTQQLRERQEFRLLKLSNNRTGGTDIWLGLRQPIPLRDMLDAMEVVSEVSHTAGRDLSPESEDPPLTVILKSGGGPVPCVSCKQPLEAGTTVCPHCRKPQT